jgi:hypothetical protein
MKRSLGGVPAVQGLRRATGCYRTPEVSAAVVGAVVAGAAVVVEREGKQNRKIRLC